MELDDFKDILEDAGVGFKESGQSLAVEYCPECCRKKYKVLFRVLDVEENRPFFGRCQSGSCGQNYSSFSYLIKMEVDRGDILAAHGQNPEKSLADLEHKTDFTEVKQTEVIKPKADTDISKFFSAEVVPKHPSTRYAVNRGYVTRLKNLIKIDSDYGAVVFLVRDDQGKVLGFQKRFTTVLGHAPKTKTSEGFRCSENVLRFKNDGPLVMCEGPFTALSAWHWGFDAISTFGSGVGPKQMDLVFDIIQSENKEILVALENDAAGDKYYEKISTYLMWKDIKQPQVILPDVGDDLNDSWMAKESYHIEDGDFINPAIPNVTNSW